MCLIYFFFFFTPACVISAISDIRSIQRIIWLMGERYSCLYQCNIEVTLLYIMFHVHFVPLTSWHINHVIPLHIFVWTFFKTRHIRLNQTNFRIWDSYHGLSVSIFNILIFLFLFRKILSSIRILKQNIYNLKRITEGLTIIS